MYRIVIYTVIQYIIDDGVLVLVLLLLVVVRPLQAVC